MLERLARGIILFSGLSIGSFLGVVVKRGEGFLKKQKIDWKVVLGIKKWGRSECDSCQRPLFWWENIPLISYLFLRGRCRTCHSPIPRWYPAVELGTGTVFLLTYFVWQKEFVNCFILILFLLISALLVFVFVFDGRNQIIPDEAIVGLIGLSLLFRFFQGAFLDYFLAGLGAASFLFLLHLITRGRGMGLGDVKFAFFMGFFLGWPKIVLAFYLAFLTGGLLGVIMILLKKAEFKQKIAFGPFLVWGTVISWWWGEKIIFFLSKWMGL